MTFTLPNAVAHELVDYAVEQAPKEACGLLDSMSWGEIIEFHPLRNFSPRPIEEFLVCSCCVEQAQENARFHQGSIILWHSHPTTSHRPSVADLEIIRQTNLPMAILSLQGHARTFAIYEPVPGSNSNHAVREAFKVHLGAIEEVPDAVGR